MSGYWPIGRRVAAAVAMATNDVMNDPTLLPNCNLTYEIRNSACSIENGLRGVMHLKDADVFIGPGCSTVAEPSSLIAKIWNKPAITYAASSRKFIDKETFSTFATITAYGRRNAFYTPR